MCRRLHDFNFPPVPKKGVPRLLHQLAQMWYIRGKGRVKHNNCQQENNQKREPDSLLQKHNCLAVEYQRWEAGGASGPPQRGETFYHGYCFRLLVDAGDKKHINF